MKRGLTKEERNEYQRRWRREHKDKVKQYKYNTMKRKILAELASGESVIVTKKELIRKEDMAG